MKHSARTPDSLYRESQRLLREGKLNDALAAADAGLAQEKSWRFRLRKAEILLAINPKRAAAWLDSSEVPPSPESRARLEMYRGWGRFLLADYKGAEAALNGAKNLEKPLHLPVLDAEIELYRGALAAQQGDPASADGCFRTALREATDNGDAYLQTRAMGSLGVLLLFTHHPDQAIYWLEKQRAEAARNRWPRSLANALGNLGSCYYRLGDYDQALKYLREAESTFRQIGDRREQQIWLGNMGNAMVDSGDLSGSVDAYRRALAIAREIGDIYWSAWWENNLAISDILLGNFDEAEQHNKEALRLKQNLHDRSDYFPRVNEARIAAGRKNFALAEKLFRALVDEPSQDPTPVLQAQSGLAELLVETGQFDRADALFQSAIATMNRPRTSFTRDEYKLSYLSTKIRFYQAYVDFLVARGENAKALEIAESSRAHLLDEKVHNGAKPQSTVTATAFQRLARSSHAVLISYWLAPKRSFLWAITQSGVNLHILPPEAQIETLVEGYRGQIEELGNPLESEMPAGKRLSEILFGRVRPLITNGTRLIVVPDRALQALNLETLPDPDDSSRYLIERVTLSIAPSLGLLADAHRTANPQRSILLMGDPETAVEEYPRLPYAAQEISMIERNFAEDRRVVSEGARAYPAAYRASDPGRFSWIHFAAHATANAENPLDSALILSRHGSDYTLTARDVMNVPLHADLVTLSACRSAGARAYSGEGLVGLSWAFLRAGAGSVVAGLWDVTDMSTATLMADFYGQLVKNVPPAEALRQAKLHLLRSNGAYRKPFYWGPFQLYTGAI